MHEIEKKLDRILLILEDDDSTKRRGLVGMVDDLKKEVEELSDKLLIIETEKKVSKAMWGLGGGAISAIIIKIIDALF